MEKSDEQINQILKELFAYDSSLTQHEAEVKQLVKQLLLAKPDTKFDAQFAKTLRQQLMQKAESLKTTGQQNKNFNWRLAMWPALAAVILLVGGFALNKTRQTTTITETDLFSGKVQIEPIGKNAFGKLAFNEAAFGRGGGGGGDNATTAAAASGSEPTNSTAQNKSSEVTAIAPKAVPVPNPETGAASLAATEPLAPIPNGMGGGTDMKIMPPSVSYRYIYKGEPITLEDTEVAVYRRQKGLSSSAAGQFLKQLRFGLLDMTKFNNVDVDSINLMEKREYGYNIMVNFREGTISINENWELWPTPDKQCQTPECYDSLRLKPGDVPADETIISIANKFLQDYGISTGNYGKPQILNYWKRDLEMATDKNQVYIPDVVTVAYPLILNGQQVFDEGGSPAGLMVNVNIRVKKASGVQELAVQKYQSSSYPAETDVKKVLKLAENGGFRPIYYASAEAGGKIEDVELGTPTKSLVKIWQYKNGMSEEIYVPALVFPVISAPKNSSAGSYFYKNNIIIPLAKEILDGDNGGIAVPLMMK